MAGLIPFRAAVVGMALAASTVAGAPAAVEAPATVLAAGDIAVCDRPGFIRRLRNFLTRSNTYGLVATTTLLDRLEGTILALGDLAYQKGTEEEFRTCYDPTWGRHANRTLPTPGNHEYRSAGAAPYFAYFGDRAGPRGAGYYSTDLGAWHIISLNSNIPAGPGTAQDRWLRRDLAATKANCILAFWHFPPFHAGPYTAIAASLFRTAHEFRVTTVLTGHQHYYQRFSPQDADGRLDLDRGVRIFIVGTGGISQSSDPAVKENSELFHTGTWGVLRLALYDGGYRWRFITARGEPFEDMGSGRCADRRAPSGNKGTSAANGNVDRAPPTVPMAR